MAKENLRKVLVCFALALGTALLYAPTLHFDFVNYDDPIYIIDNFHIRTLSWQSLAWCFQLGYANLWHPLTWMSHLLDFQWYGLHPGGHHATSVLLHIFNSTLLFLVLNRMTKALWRSAMVAALFAWHPLHVESVAWISERKDVLCAFFWMLTVWAYVRYAEECSPRRTWQEMQNVHHVERGKKCKVFYGLALFFFALGLMAKPMLVTLPFVLLLLDWWPLGRMQFEPPNPNPNLNPTNSHGSTTRLSSPKSESRPAVARPAECRAGVLRLLIEKIPFLLLSVIGCGLTLKAANRLVALFAGYPLLPRGINALLAYFRYVEKMVWPADMVVVYPLEFRWSGAEVMVAGLFVIVVSVVAVRVRGTRPYWLVGWLFYLGILVPVIGLVQVGAHPMADHYIYLPSIGIFMIICWEACDIGSGWLHGRAILGTVAALVLGASFVLSSKQLEYWRNPVTLFTHNLEVTPGNYVAHADYAAFLRDSMQLEPARAECEKAVLLEPNYGWAHQVLGGVLFLEGKLDDADAELRTAFRLDPNRLDVHMALGQVALARNSPGEASAQYGTVLAAEPRNAEAHCGLGQALARQGKLDEARAQDAEALRLAPQYPEAHHQLAAVLALQHNTAEAAAQYRMTLALQPDRPDTLNNLAWILATDPHPEIRNGADAVKFASTACRLTRDRDPFMLGTLAACYAENGDFEEAVATAQQAHDLAVAQGKTDIAARNLQLLALYRARQPYHEKSPGLGDPQL